MHLVTNAGTYEVAGDRVRFVLRDSRGTILRSTRFTAVPVEESVGGVLRMEVHGTGYGHGVGMCQWGAIGRARAGQDYREILLTYYRGARIEKYGDSSPSSPNS
jgi:stage II sporulation protein D